MSILRKLFRSNNPRIKNQKTTQVKDVHCPYCDALLAVRPTRKTKCPVCSQVIVVRMGQLVTEEDGIVFDWLHSLAGLGIGREDFYRTRESLSRRFKTRASINDTVWSLLNSRKALTAGNERYRQDLLAKIISDEGKDPAEYLEKTFGKNVASKDKTGRQLYGYPHLKYAAKLRREGKLDQATQYLTKAQVSPAVLDELRKIASARARLAKKEGNWQAVIDALDGYTRYAYQSRGELKKLTNSEPPEHTKTDKNLLEQARQHQQSRS